MCPLVHIFLVRFSDWNGSRYDGSSPGVILIDVS